MAHTAETGDCPTTADGPATAAGPVVDDTGSSTVSTEVTMDSDAPSNMSDGGSGLIATEVGPAMKSACEMARCCTPKRRAIS
jgi:hypothetical protein